MRVHMQPSAFACMHTHTHAYTHYAPSCMLKTLCPLSYEILTMTLTGKFCPTFIDKNVKVCGDSRLPRVIHPGNSNLGFPKPRPIQNSKAHKSLNVDVWTCACRVSSLGRGNQERQDRCNQGRASFVWLHFKQR